VKFRIRKGTHLSHFHERCALWPTQNFYEQDKPLWWGNLCDECSKLADMEASQSRIDLSRKAGTGC
jgi:hypothetical protein